MISCGVVMTSMHFVSIWMSSHRGEKEGERDEKGSLVKDCCVFLGCSINDPLKTMLIHSRIDSKENNNTFRNSYCSQLTFKVKNVIAELSKEIIVNM